MNDHSTMPDLEELDQDGAVQESWEALERAGGFHDDPADDPFASEAEDDDQEGLSRAGLLRRGGLGAVLVGGGVFGLAAAPALAQRNPRTDRAILNYALTLEYLEAAFYADAISQGEIRGEDLQFARVVGQHENQHVTLLRAALGRAAVRRPRFSFGASTRSTAAFRATALALEETGIRAYGGQITRISSPALVTVGAQIHAVEARHAAWMADILGRTPAPASLNGYASRGQVLGVVRRTGFIRG
ncbi:MAG TPA: ferritin-like domain-containing protein [Miltoncostaeaceae bacterium]|jgi:hypothetical protein|nr:ferritin-like domain-containing protein [Miltoncostaeaceae bacterium]